MTQPTDPDQPSLWSAPPPNQSQYSQPVYGQPGHGQPQAPPAYQPTPTGQWEPLGTTESQPAAPHRGRGRLVASIVTVIAIAGGGAATYVALSDSSSNGASSAEDAVRSVVNDINKSDLIGVLDDLTPGERAALANPFLDAVNQLKRTKVLKGEANPSKVTGLNLDIKNLTFSGKSLALTDSVQVVEITGGTLDVSSDVRAVPFTDAFVKAVFPKGLPSSANAQHVDIAQEAQRNGKPLHVAAQKVGGKWYPSLGYTIAYQVTNEQLPSASDEIAPKGADSADAAVRAVVDAALSANVSRLVELASPDELGPVHTYGGLIVSSVGRYHPPGFTVDELTFTDKSIADGTRVFLKSLKFHTTGGDSGSVTIDGNCYAVIANGKSKRSCPSEAAAGIASAIESFGLVAHVTQAQRDALTDLVSGLGSFGIDASKSGGQWYVNPVRTYVDLLNEALSGLRGNDAIDLLTLISQGR